MKDSKEEFLKRIKTMNKDIDEMLDKLETASDTMISNTFELPLLVCRIAQNSVTIRNDPNIRTEKERNAFMIDDLVSYSKKLKDENCLGYMFIDKYIESLKAI